MKVKYTPGTASAEDYKDLTIGNIYRVIDLMDEDVRVMSDEGLPYLYPLLLFTIVDPQRPSDWVVTYGEDGEQCAAPKVLNEPGFWERYFEGDSKAISIVRKRLAHWRHGND